MDRQLSKEVAQLANDLATKGIFQLSGDLPVVGDALKRAVAILADLDVRVQALEKRVPVPEPGIAGPNVGSKVPPGAQA